MKTVAVFVDGAVHAALAHRDSLSFTGACGLEIHGLRAFVYQRAPVTCLECLAHPERLSRAEWIVPLPPSAPLWKFDDYASRHSIIQAVFDMDYAAFMQTVGLP